MYINYRDDDETYCFCWIEIREAARWGYGFTFVYERLIIQNQAFNMLKNDPGDNSINPNLFCNFSITGYHTVFYRTTI